jgi:hypothetical protein
VPPIVKKPMRVRIENAPIRFAVSIHRSRARGFLKDSSFKTVE